MNDEFFDDDVYESPRPRRRSKAVSREDRREAPVRERAKRRSKQIDVISLEILGDRNQLLKVIAVLVLFIVTTSCGIAVFKLFAPIVILIQLILIFIGLFLKGTPPYVPVFIASLILIVGMITKMADICMCADAVLLATVMAFRSKR